MPELAGRVLEVAVFLELEAELNLPNGQFNVQPSGQLHGFVDARGAAWVIYPTVLAGWAYLATVIDGFSRQVIGWAVADHMRGSGRW